MQNSGQTSDVNVNWMAPVTPRDVNVNWMAPVTPRRTPSGDPPSKKFVEQVVKTAGGKEGKEKLLKLFRFRERILVSAEPPAPVTPDGEPDLRRAGLRGLVARQGQTGQG